MMGDKYLQDRGPGVGIGNIRQSVGFTLEDPDPKVYGALVIGLLRNEASGEKVYLVSNSEQPGVVVPISEGGGQPLFFEDVVFEEGDNGVRILPREGAVEVREFKIEDRNGLEYYASWDEAFARVKELVDSESFSGRIWIYRLVNEEWTHVGDARFAGTWKRERPGAVQQYVDASGKKEIVEYAGSMTEIGS